MEQVTNSVYNLAVAAIIAIVGMALLGAARGREFRPEYAYASRVEGRRVVRNTKYKYWWSRGRLKVTFKKPTFE